MRPIDIQLLIFALVVFIAAPYLPTSFYSATFSNMIVPAILLVGLLVSMSYSLFGAVGLLFAVAALFIEHRRRTFQEVKGASYEQQMAPAEPVVPGEIHPPADAPPLFSPRIHYAPSENATNEFQSVGLSINKKRDMGGPRIPAEAEKYIIEHSLAQLN